MQRKSIHQTALRIALTLLVASLLSSIRPPEGQAHGLANNEQGTPVAAQLMPHSQAHLPLVMRHYPPLPDRAALLPIENADQDGDYALTWQAALRAETYELVERRQDEEWAIVYHGPATHTEVIGRPSGVYAYRLRARNSWGYGLWSAERSVTVAGDPPGQMPQPPSLPQDADGLALLRVINDCPYALGLQFTGPNPATLTITRCEVCHVYTFIGPIFCPTENRPIGEIRLVPGAYRVYATVDQPDVKPYIGRWELEADRRYSLCFYILRR